MPVNKIIIDNKQTKAERISPEKIQLDLVAIPMDDENDAEPNLNLNLYINGELLKTLQSDENGFVKENLVVNDEGGEQVMIKLEDVIGGIQSKIKCIMIEGGNDKVESKEIIIPKDKQKIIEFVKKNGRNLSDEKCKDYINDFDVVMEAVKQNGLALQFASENLKNNYDIVMEAIKQNGLALEFASENLENNYDIVMESINQNGSSFRFVSEYLRSNHEVYILALMKDVYNYSYLSENIISEDSVLEILMEAAIDGNSVLGVVQNKYKKNSILYLKIDALGRLLQGNDKYYNGFNSYLPAVSCFNNNKKIISNYISINGYSKEYFYRVLQYLYPKLRNDSQFIKELKSFSKSKK